MTAAPISAAGPGAHTPMRITQIIPSLEARHGGPSNSVPALAGACAQLGNEVTLLTTTIGAETTRTEGTLRISAYPRGWPGRLCPSAGLRAALARDPADILHYHSLWLRPLHYAHRGARLRGAKLVISPRGMMTSWAWHHHRAQKWLANLAVHPGALAAAAGWHATSPEEAADIRRLGFIQPICVAPNGVAVPPADQLVAARAHWHQVCPATTHRPVALFFSRFHRKKRLRELLQLWLAASRGDWLLLLVGVPEEYSLAEVQGWIDAAGARDRVAVFDGAGRPPPYAVASLFLLPSHSENFGLVIAEAMAAGVPTLVTDTTPWTALNAEDRGWCVPWAQFNEALASALAEGTDRLQGRGARARGWVVNEYSWEKSARELVRFYRQLGGSSP